jgi:hypothetical protein
MDIENLKDTVADKVKNNYKPNTAKKKILLGVLVVLFGALGLEMSNNDFDVEKLVETGSFSESRVLRDKSGNVVTEGGKFEDEYNCADFTTQIEAQTFFDKAGGVSKDFNRLDGNKDGQACESLPKGKN